MRTLLTTIAAIMLMAAISLPVAAADSDFTVGRFVVCKRIVDREPADITTTFDKKTRIVYAFLEAIDITRDTSIKIQWLFEGKETALLELAIKAKSGRWRTYSRKRIGIRHGNWEVRLLDSKDNIITSQKFVVK